MAQKLFLPRTALKASLALHRLVMMKTLPIGTATWGGLRSVVTAALEIPAPAST